MFMCMNECQKRGGVTKALKQEKIDRCIKMKMRRKQIKLMKIV